MDKATARRRFSWLRCAIWLTALGLFFWAWAILTWSAHATGLRAASAGFSGAALILLAWWKRGHPATPVLALLFASLSAATVTLLIRPNNERVWEVEQAQLPWADVHGDVVTLHNYRHFDWHSENEATPRWETRQFPLSALRHVDFLMTYWGSSHICHTMISFDFGAHGRVCASIEARREVGEGYSAFAGVFRRYELAYILGDERDLLRVRTNLRPNNEVYLYRLTATPEAARTQFLEYVRAANELRTQPQWYNTLVSNCSTLIRQHARALNIRLPWDWRLLANGHVDEYLHRLGYLSQELPLTELKRRSNVTPAAKLAPLENFPEEIRRGLPGF